MSIGAKGDGSLYTQMTRAYTVAALERYRALLTDVGQRTLAQRPDAEQFPLLCPVPLFGQSVQSAAEVSGVMWFTIHHKKQHVALIDVPHLLSPAGDSQSTDG